MMSPYGPTEIGRRLGSVSASNELMIPTLTSSATCTAFLHAMVFILLGLASPASPCSLTYSPTTEEMLKKTQVIVRATAVGVGSGQSGVRFHVLEVLRGEDVPEDFELGGSLTDEDDFN